MFHAAHFLTIETSANQTASLSNGQGLNSAFAAVGGVSSASVGDVSVSMALATPDASDPWGNFRSTSFGQELIRIMKKMGKGALVSTERRTDIGFAPNAQGVCL